ncbi:MAG: arylesterase [Campylobacteraceae bacterium]|nr:arylesterase [Campylobacteraceae bacterium]
MNQEVDAGMYSLPLDTKILAFGDSLTLGYGVSKTESYPSKLSELLHVEVINAGVSGELSEQGLLRLPHLLEIHKPDILILCHGANDILKRRDLSKTKENLSQMVFMAKQKGIYVLLVGVPSYEILSFSVPSFYYEIAKESGIEMEDTSLKKILDSDSLKSDQVHPNALGYEMMSKYIAKVLSENYTSARP